MRQHRPPGRPGGTTREGTMCFDLDACPPIAPMAGRAVDAGDLTLTSADGTRVPAFAARATQPTGAGMLVRPDVLGLQAYHKELATRFAVAGVDAVAIDDGGRADASAHSWRRQP